MDGNNPSPEPKAWLLSSIYFFWANRLFSSTKRRNRNGEELEYEDIFDLPPAEKTTVLTEKFEDKWYSFLDSTPEEELTQKAAKTQFKWALWGVVRKQMIFAGIFRLLNSILQLSSPFILQQLLIVVQEIDEKPISEGIFWAVLLGLIPLMKAVIESRYYWLIQRGGWRSRSIVSTAVYRKSLKLNVSSKQFVSQGQVVNLMQLDAEKLERFALSFHAGWDSLVQLIGYCSVLFYFIQEGVFVGLCVVVVTLPTQICVISKLFGYVRQIAGATDERVKVVNEALQSMLAVKAGAWEYSFGERIKNIRSKELKPLKKSLIVRSTLIAYISTVPVLTAVAALSYYGLRNQDDIKAATLFAALQAFEAMRFPLMQLPLAISTYADAKVSQMRLARFLSLPETKSKESIIHDIGKYDDENKKNIERNEEFKQDEDEISTTDVETAIVIDDGEFFWSKGTIEGAGMFKVEKKKKKNKKSMDEESIPTENQEIEERAALIDINLKISKGDLVGVVGSVGSGKSTLLSAILGELNRTKGSVSISGSLAYCSQTAWILNATLRENILFGLDFDESRYNRVLKVCQLNDDLELLQDGDKTMIGERGINLSGGQAQRVSVARALYSHAQIILLDDPVSALDPEVGRKLFEDCICGMFKEEGRTIVMVTNQLHFLEHCDYVVLLEQSKDESSGVSRIKEQGSFENLMESKSDFADLIKSFQGDNEKQIQENKDEDYDTIEATAEPKAEKKDGDLMQAEERQQGTVKFKFYWNYIKAGGICTFLIALILLMFALGAGLFNTFVVSFWADDPFYENYSIGVYLAAYGISAVVMGIFHFGQSFFFYLAGVRASRRIHALLVEGIFSAPMSFFDTTPTGRIISRFSKDIFSLDNELPPNIFLFASTIGSVITAVAAVASQIPEFLIVVPFMTLAYLYVMRSYRPTARDVKRLENMSRSPLYAQFSETLGGLSSIRAFGKVPQFVQKSEQLVDASLKTTYAVRIVERWLAVRLDTLSALLTMIAALLVVYAAENQGLTAGLAGLVLAMIINFSSLVSGALRSFVIVETNMNALERVYHYAHDIEKEAPFNLEEGEHDAEWPSTGEIILENASMRYREDTPKVLNGVNVTIEGGSKVGVIGRTGCGKSSLMLTLLRIVELETGIISIDGVDISTLGLHVLRKKISMVPQNPVMFSGTVRSNLDPFGNSSDEDLWEALKQVNLADYVEGLPDQLMAEVAEYGENFSQGQRQLLCMARSLLEKSKILLLDEATSSVDYETDAIIQNTIRASFSECTILTIAHRIQTVADYDKLVVMKEGKVAEFDSPSNLLADPNSEFSNILAEMGQKIETRIKDLVLSNNMMNENI